jgi:DNA repair protein RecO (recombination protein O)
MEWQDEGFLLERRPHGESAAILSVLTREHGRHAGLVHGGQNSGKTAMLQPGNLLKLKWRARLPEHLGTFDCELVSSSFGFLLDDPGRLAALQSAAGLVHLALPEREAHPGIFESFAALTDALAGEAWAPAYIFWEYHLLQSLGFAVDMSVCAVTGARDNLAYVSPRTGRAVTESAAQPYRDRLLPLPPFLIGGAYQGPQDLVDGLKLTAHFLERYVTSLYNVPLPPARGRLVEICRAMRTSEA